jgi:hypothetical protein
MVNDLSGGPKLASDVATTQHYEFVHRIGEKTLVYTRRRRASGGTLAGCSRATLVEHPSPTHLLLKKRAADASSATIRSEKAIHWQSS